MKDAFSNGSEFEIWESHYCANCNVDRAFRERGFDGDDGCQLIALGMIGEDVPEWTEDPERAAQGVWPRVLCANFTSLKGAGE